MPAPCAMGSLPVRDETAKLARSPKVIEPGDARSAAGANPFTSMVSARYPRLAAAYPQIFGGKR